MVENPVISRVAFEGNKKVKDEQLKSEIQSKPRGTLSRPMVQSDAQRIAEIYRHAGRYDITSRRRSSNSPTTASISFLRLPKARRPASSPIEFIGNTAFSSYRLKDVIKTHELNLPELHQRR